MDSLRSSLQPDRETTALRSWSLRIAAASLVVVLVGLLATAWTLNPDASGLGTHHQLGLPPCSIRVLFGIRCPSCGMTTSWAHAMNGEFRAAARASVGGFLLVLYALGGLATMLQIVRRGKMPAEKTIRHFTIALIAIAVVTLADWGVRVLGQ
ncbi:DUF2752 domain-containing protein [Stieleria sp. ICT_E10.1]|uniref:DUF2752 domain-containing protein n=1 Tax=Stieleria sedimenti TaxID=2976331 RepID=UPI00217FFF42|nr:DUF2752 domain-containing protein [Stieleria sedimenti]MCS7469072.1 DUF2752 domain-containing protein [Stieleria sedimenti]